MAASSTGSSSHTPLHVVIAGGGVGGLALAFFLLRVGVRATVVERRGEGEVGGSWVGCGVIELVH